MTAIAPDPAPQAIELLDEQTRLQRDIRAGLIQLQKAENAEQEVVLTDIDIPFSRMVAFMVKWSLASIPAGIILGILVGGCFLALMSAAAVMGIGLSGLR